MHPNRISLALAGLVLSAAFPALAVTVAGQDPNSSAYLVSAGGYGSAYSGVVQLTISRPDLGAGAVVGCSGTLLADGVSILTAAHCVANSAGVETASSANVVFELPSGLFATQSTEFMVDPRYSGAVMDPSDLAIVRLSSQAPSDANRYNLYTGTTLNQVLTLAGYGIGGTGATGYNSAANPYGSLRVGQNQYDTTVGSSDLGFDFDSGLAANDAFGTYLGIPGLGLGSSEAFVSPGDSGGPSFINGEIAGVHSFIGRFSDVLPISMGINTDVDGVLDSSFGEYAGDVSVANNLSFLTSSISLASDSTPEPALLFLVGIALVMLSLVRPNRRCG